MQLAVCITTHIPTLDKMGARKYSTEYMRTQGNPQPGVNYLSNYACAMLDRYASIDPGPIDVTFYILDSGSSCPDFHQHVRDLTGTDDRFHFRQIKNHGGFVAGMKYIIHESMDIRTGHDFFLFHVDDGVEPVEEGWGLDLIEHYKQASPNKFKLMGRRTDTTTMAPWGFPTWSTNYPPNRKFCPHLPMLWGVSEEEDFTICHADWWFMDAWTLNELAIQWYNPFMSAQAMAYQMKFENMDFHEVEAADRYTLIDMHCGREVGTSLLITKLGGELIAHPNSKLREKQLLERAGFVIDG